MLTNILKTIAALLIILFVSNGTSTMAQQTTEKPKTIKITDSKLIGIDRALDSVEYWVDKLKQGDSPGCQKQLGELEKVAARFNRAKAADKEQRIALQARFADLATKIQAKSKSASKPSSKKDESQNTPSKKMTAEQAKALEKKIAEKYEKEVLIPESRKMFKSGALTAEDAKYFIEGMKVFNENVKQDIVILTEAQKQGGGNWMLKRLTGEYGLPGSMEREIDRLKKTITSKVESGFMHAKSCSTLDPEKNRYVFKTQSVRENYIKRMQDTITTLEQASKIEQALEMEPTWSPKLEQVESFLEQFNKIAAVASKHNTLPKAVGTKEQEMIAKKVLAVKKYGVGEINRMIVNSKTVPRDRDEIKSFAGRLERVVRVWEEFQVCTVEEENGKYFVYFNTIAKFSRAPNPTPVGEWIIRKRWKSGEIDPENLK